MRTILFLICILTVNAFADTVDLNCYDHCKDIQGFTGYDVVNDKCTCVTDTYSDTDLSTNKSGAPNEIPSDSN